MYTGVYVFILQNGTGIFIRILLTFVGHVCRGFLPAARRLLLGRRLDFVVCFVLVVAVVRERLLRKFDSLRGHNRKVSHEDNLKVEKNIRRVCFQSALAE